MALIDALLDDLIASRGSDLHLAVGHPPLARQRGDLAPLRDGAVTAPEMEDLLFEIISPDERTKITTQLDLDFTYTYADRARFRASYFYKSTGLAAVFRALPTRVSTLEELGCPEVIRRIAERRSGLVLVTGPAGSGKSATLAAMVDHINRTRACHVLTIEDPVELSHAPVRAQVTHREVGADASSFASALRSASREDADVVMIGDLKSGEIIRQALELASCGALVLAAMPGTGAAALVDRVINTFPAEEQPQARGLLADCLAAVVAQQLVRAEGGKGRVAAHEILLGSPALASMIRDGKTAQVPSLMQAGGKVGMQTMDIALEGLWQRGLISAEDALEKAADKESFQKLVTRRTAQPVM